MNAYIWTRSPTHDHDNLVAWHHGTTVVRFPRNMLVTVPPILTDANVADLRAAFLRDKDQLNAS